MNANGLFLPKELAVLAKLRAHLISTASPLSRSEKAHLPGDRQWQSCIENNDRATLEGHARFLRTAAGIFQCDSKAPLPFKAALFGLITPIHARLLNDNQIPVFEETPDDLVFPEDAAEAYKQELAGLEKTLAAIQSENQKLAGENASLQVEIARLRAELEAERKRVDELIAQGRGWQVNILKNVSFKIGDISLGGEWIDSVVTLIRDKSIRDLLAKGLRRAAAVGKRWLTRLSKWATHYAVESIERGARKHIEAFGKLEDAVDPPPPGFDYVEVYNRLLRGEGLPAAWAPHVTELDFHFANPHHLG